MAITQKELAESLGMSRANVGNALNGNPRVSAKTRQRVIEAARRHGYSLHSNNEARALIARRYGKRIRHDMIAVMMGELDGTMMRDLPYYAPIFHGIEQEAIVRGVDVALHAFRKHYLPRYIEEKRVDGVIGLATTPERNKGLYEDGVPVIGIGTKQGLASSLLPDARAGIALTVGHLAELGHRRIAFVGHELDREEAYRDTMESLGLPAPAELVVGGLPIPFAESGTEGVRALLDRGAKFTALVCHNDNIAMGAIQCLEEHGLSVPGDVSVTGFDDLTPAYGFVPPLTSVGFDREGMGRRAVGLFYEIFEQMAEAGPSEPVPLIHEVFPVELVVRDSTRRVTKKMLKRMC